MLTRSTNSNARYPVSMGLLLLVTLAACTPTVDGSSDEAFERSLEEVRSALSEDQREDFNDAITTLAFGEADLSALLTRGVDGVTADVRAQLDGKTATEILADAAEVVAERERKQREQALEEIAELEQKHLNAEEARAQLRGFVVESSRFAKVPQRFGPDEPIIRLSVRNETEHAISRAYFAGTIASPGRAVPWLRADFNYRISGGIEPGEAALWRLAPNRFSEWGTVEAPADAVFTVEVVRLDGADGEPLFDARGLSESERARLASLKETYGIE